MRRAVLSRGFRALVADKAPTEGPASRMLEFASVADLPRQDPDADVEVAVTHTTLNYKDAMIVNGERGVVKDFPIVGGIDYAGVVSKSSSPLWREGDAVVLTGNKAGQFFDGGYAERAACRAEWLVAPPAEFSLAQSMTIGTAGVTAAMCVHYLERFGEVRPSHGPVLVTGAAGGLGQLAIALLAARGFEVVASTGRGATLTKHLEALGASKVIGRLEPELDKRGQPRPLGTQKWAGVVDSVGGSTLATALAQTRYRGAIASPGVAGGGVLETSVYPLILRGVRVLGVDQTMPWDLEGYPRDSERWAEWRAERQQMWRLLAELLDPEKLELVRAGTIGLEDIVEYAPKVIKAEVAGRLLVEVAGE